MAACVYVVVPFGYIIFPILTAFLALFTADPDDDDTEALPTHKTEPAPDKESFKLRYSKVIDLAVGSCFVVSLGALVQLMWSNGWVPGVTDILDQRVVATLHALVAFKAISFFKGYVSCPKQM